MKQKVKYDSEVLAKLKKQFEEAQLEIRKTCFHYDPDTKEWYLKELQGDEKGLVECTECGAKFNVSKVQNKELFTSFDTVDSVINQIKLFGPDDTDADLDIKSKLGNLAFQIEKIPQLYIKVCGDEYNNNRKSNKKNKKSRNGFDDNTRFFE